MVCVANCAFSASRARGAARHHHDAARPLVEAVHDARTEVLVTFGGLERMEVPAREQPVHERAGPLPGAGCTTTPAGLHEHDERVVDVEHLESAPLASGDELGRAAAPSGCDLDARALAHRRPSPRRTDAVDGHAPRFDPALQLACATALLAFGEGADEKTVDAGAARATADRRSHYQSFDLMCPLALIRMSTSARS